MDISKFIYRSNPIFREKDKEAIEAWESRTFDTMLIFCKLYRNEEGKYGIGYSVLFDDGWEHGSFHEHLGKAMDIKEASLKGLFELLVHAREESAKKVVIWTENVKFIDSLSANDIRRKKQLRELYDSFEEVKISNIDQIEIENLENLRDSAFSSARSGAQRRTRRMRYKVILQVSERHESESELKRRHDEFIELMAEIVQRHAMRPIEEKLRDAENELKELENNIEEQLDYQTKRASLLVNIEELKKQKVEFDKRKEILEKQRHEEEHARIVQEQNRIAQIKLERKFCFKCNNNIEKDWRFCPFCAANLEAEIQC